MEKDKKEKFNKDCLFQGIEEDSNLIDFFDLLLKVDKRNNPHLYKLEKDNKNND